MSIKDELERKYGHKSQGGAGGGNGTNSKTPVRADAQPKKNYSIKSANTSVAMRERYGSDTSPESVARYQQRLRQTAQQGFEKFRADREARLGEKLEPGRLGAALIDTLEKNPVTFTTGRAIRKYQEYKNDDSWREPTGEWEDGWLEEFGLRYNADPEDAFEYARMVNDYINAGKQGQQREKLDNWAYGNRFLATGAALLAAPVGVLDFADKATEFAARGAITQKGDISSLSFSREVTGSIARQLNENNRTLDEFLRDKTGNENIHVPALGDKSWGDVYSLGNSTLQSLALGNATGKVGTLVTFFGQSGAAGVEEIKARGGSDEQALVYGLLSGAAEALAEYLPLDNLLKGGDAVHYTLRSWLGNVMKQAGMEGTEELVTSLSNEMADRWVMGDQSNFALRVQELTAAGNSQEDARKKAWLEFAEGAAFDFIGGAVSGAGSMAVQTALPTAMANLESGRKYTPEMRAGLLELAGQTEEGSRPYRLAQKYAKAGKLTGGQINQLAGVYQEYTDQESAEPVSETDGFAGEAGASAQTAQEDYFGEGEEIDPDAEGMEPETPGRTIEEAAEEFGEQAGAVVKYYEDEQDVESYVRGFRAAYDMGKSGISQDYALRSASAEGLTDHQRKQAWLTGKGAAALEAQRAGQTNAAKATGGTVRKKGTVRAEGVTLQELQAGFNDRQKSAYKLLSTYAEATGVDVVLYRSQADEDGRFTGESGSYHWDTSTVRLDVNAGLSRGTDIGTLGKYTMMKTYSHEFTHFCEQWSPEQYDSFRQEVFTAMEENGENPADLIEELMAEYADLDYDTASREVVAEAMVDILENSDFISRIAQTDKTLFDKLREKIAEFVQKVRDYWKGMVTTNARGAVAVKEQVGENLKYLEKIQKLWDDMAVNAVESYQATVAAQAERSAQTETVEQPAESAAPEEPAEAERKSDKPKKTEKKPALSKTKKSEWGSTDTEWYVPGRKSPIAYSTKAVSDAIEVMADEYPADTIRELIQRFPYGPDERKVLQRYVDAGYGDQIANEWFSHEQKGSKKPKAAEPILDKPSPAIEPVAEPAAETAAEDASEIAPLSQEMVDALVAAGGKRRKLGGKDIVNFGPRKLLDKAAKLGYDVDKGDRDRLQKVKSYIDIADGSIHSGDELLRKTLERIVTDANTSKEETDHGKETPAGVLADRPLGQGDAGVSGEHAAADRSADDAGGEPVGVPEPGERPAGRDDAGADAEAEAPGGSGEGDRQSGVSGVSEESAEAPKPKKPRKKATPKETAVEESPAAEAEDAPAPITEAVQEAVERASTEEPGGNNWVIGDSLELPQGNAARMEANLEAVRIIKRLNASGQNATASEQAQLAKYVGWGGLDGIFDERKAEYAEARKELKELLTEEEYRSARASTTTAFYTDIGVIRAMYDGLKGLGFTGGRLLEPAAGVGHFAGAMPADLRQSVRSMTMVELDSITGSIAKHLYPGMDVRVEGFEKTNLPGGFMDAAVGNVPFGNFGVVDKTYPKKITAAIHNYFFAKTLDKVRTGGIVMMITSRHTMDSSDATVREYISKRADLLGAIRLPNTAFKGNAGTEVVSDILILKKRAPGTAYGGQEFVRAEWAAFPGRGGSTMNTYFKHHPEMVMGEHDLVRGRYGLELTVNPKNGDLGQQIREAFGKIDGKMGYPAVQTVDRQNFAVERAAGKPKSGGYALKDGKLVKNENGSLVDAKVDEKTAKRLTGMIGIRDATRKLQNVQQQGLNADTIRKARKELNRLYDEFVAKYGYLNAPANRNAIREDPDRYSLLALENYDTDTRSGSKADIFTKNTIAPNRTVTSAGTVAEGLIVSRNQTGGVDTAFIARLTGKHEEEVTRELIDTRLAFKRADGTLEAAETYLSGNVRAKLREAEGLAPMDKDFRNNVEALRPIIPKDIPHTEIHVNPGATWVPPMVYGDFAAEMLGGSNNDYRSDVVVKYRPQTGTYVVELNSHYLRYNARNTQKWGAGGKTFIELLEAMLNSKTVTVWRKVGDNRVVDEAATAAANEKVERIAEEFRSWLWKDTERRTELGRLYNEQFNCLVNPKYDGSGLTFNGMNAGIQLRPHQKDAVQRIISSGGNTLLAHRVGAGKTFEMAAAAMKLKELGLVRKPMFAVPKSLVAQWGKEFADLFPTARLMVAEAGDFTPDNRKLFANRVANGDYDAVIVSYEQFEKLPISADFSRRLYQEQVDSIVDAIAEAKYDAGKKASVKDLERTRRSLESKIQKLTDSEKDDDIRFEELGVDALFVDEAHNFKNLFYTTSMTNVAGLGNKDGSKRAFDLYTKVRYLQQLNGGRGIVFATATPVMNSMAEMYIMQRYLQPKMLEQLGIDSFDAWAKQFGEVVNGVEIKPSGQGYRVKQSFSRFKNLPELQLLFRNMADVMTQVPGLEVPKMKGGKVQVIECKPGQFQKDYMKELETRADHIKGVDPSVDNMLKITSDGRKISYTQRMIEPSLPYEEGCKLFRCADKVLEVYKKTSKDKGTQMIFLDMATPKGKAKAESIDAEEGMDLESARLYEDLRARLIDGGIPAKEIAFIHDADTDAKKKKLFQSVNDGDVRVLIGSTGKMGVGMNAQRRAVAIHHLDAPWRPGDVEQRNGRVFRQGNRNKEVSCFHYVTVGSFDARLWDILERKQGFIDQVMEGGDVGREAEDTGEVTLSAAEVKALASGSPLILEQVKLQTEIKKLENLRRAHGQAVMDAARGLAANRAEAKTLEGYIAKAGEDLKRRTDAYMDKKFTMTIGRKTYTDIKEAGVAMMAAAEKSAKDSGYTTIGTFAGFDLRVVKTAEGIQAMLSGAQGYTFKTYPKNTTHMINVMRDTAGHIDSARKAWQSRLERARADIAEQEALASKPFEQEAELDAARKRYNEIMRQLTPGNEQRMDSLDSGEEKQQAQARRAELTDREVLELAAGEIDRESLTDAEQAALDIIYTKLRGLEALEDRRKELGQLYREQQFGAKVDRDAAAATLAEMHELDKQIPQAENAVLEGDSATLKAVLRKARKVVRDQERAQGEQKLKRYRERRNNSAQIKKYRDRITTDVNEMMDWVLRPDGKNAMKHIPEALRGAVLPFLESIDMTSKRALGGGADTKADQKYRRRLEALRDAIHDNYAQSYAAWELPPDFMDKLDKQLRALREITDGSSGGILNQMTAQELKDLSEIVANLKKFIRNFNRFHANAMMQHVHEAGDSTIRELRLSPSDNGSTGGVKNFLFWKNIKPAYAFERFGLGGKAIWDGLRRGQSKLAFRTKEIEEFSRKTWNAKQVKAWEKEVHHIDLRGDKITMTTADIMSFYELCKRPQALSHILGDGGRIATRTRKLGEGKDAQIVDYGHQFNEEDIQTICDVLTEEQKKVADAMQQYMAKVGGAWGNEVSMHRFGVQQFGEDTYFPISVDSSFIDATVDERPNSASLYSLLNMGFTKALTPEAKNRIVVYSIFDVFAAHMGEMASYNAMALPVLDAVKWLNYSSENADTPVSVRDELRRVYGAPGEGGGKSARGYAEKFIVNILRGFNGTEAQAAPNDSTGLKMLHRYNRAQVAFNLRVMVQQPTAILRAGMILDTKAILSGLKSIPVLKKNIAEMRKHSGIAAWKGLGFYDVNISRGLNAIIKQDGTFLDKATDLGLKGAEMADSATWGAIWYACKSQVVRSGVKTTDADFFPKVTELFEEVIYKTQVVDSILTKTEYMRDKGFFSRLTSSFMGEPVTSANMLLDTAQKIDLDRRRGMSPAWLVKTHGGELARRTAVYSLSGLATVAIASLIDALRDDDDYQDYWEKWQEAFTGDIGEELNPLGKLPLVSDAWDLLRAVWETAAGGDPWVQVANLPMADIASYAVQGTEILRDKFTGKDTNYTWYGGVYKLLQALSGASGAPMAALTRDIVSVWNAMFPSKKVKTYDSGQKNEIKFAYMDGWLSQEEAMSHLLEQELVEDEDEGYWLIRKWDENEGWSRFQELTQAVLGNGDVNTALSELTGHGYDADEAASEVKSELGKMYRDREIDRPALEKALRNKVFGMDADEIKATVDKWSCEIVTGIAYGDIRDAYLDGKITAARAAEMRQRYGGESREDALETVREWQCEKDTGVAYSDIADAFSRGKITEAQAKRMYITYGGMSEEDAAEKTEVMAFVRDNPDCKGISYAALEGYRESCEGSGVKPADYYKVWKFNSTAQADVDESGKSVSGTKKRKVLEYIDSLSLTNAQKDSLYYAFGWARSTIGEAPWH